MARTTPTKQPEPVEATEPVEASVEEAGITAAEFVQSASHAVAVNGLLASDPQLRTATLPDAKWEALLAAYLASPRP